MNLSNGIYTFRNVAYPDKMLNLYYDERNNILINGQNVILYDSDKSLEQQWKYNGTRLLTMRNNSYALDRYVEDGPYLYNADVWNVNAYSQDQILQAIIQNDNVPNGIEADGVVVIQLSDGCMNLTAVSNQNGSNSGKTSTSGGNVYWAQQSSNITNAQKWYYKRISGTVLVESVMVDRSTLSLFVGEKDQLYADVLPYNASNQTLEWESSNTNVATVTKDGFVTAVGVGTTQIKAKAKDGSGKYGTCTLTVTGYVPVTDVSLNKNQITIEKGDNYSLVATVSPSNATYKAVIWESSNTNVAKVTGGKVTALSKGTATITVKSTDNSNYRDTCTVTVTDTTTGNDTETDTDTGDVNDVKVTSITIEYENDEVTVGENFFVHKTVCPQNATNKEVTWSSSNTTVATVNPESGFVYAKNAGSTIITATACDGSGTNSSFRLTVNAADIKVSSIKLNEYNICLEKGKTKRLVATPLPSNAANKAVSWISCEPCVATVDANGNVEAVGVGKTTITATAKDGSGKSATCTVQVTENILVEYVRVSPSTKTMTVGQSEYLHEIVCPTNATNKCVRWTSDNTNVVTVNYESGLVFAQGVGTAKIRATAQDGSKKYGEATVYVQPPKAVTGIELCPQTKTLNVGQTAKLDVTIFPYDATNKRVTWCSSDENVACIDYYTGQICANDVGTTVITATTVDGCFTSSSTITVYSTDPFHHSNIEYIRIKKWRSLKTNGYGNYIECDMTTTATKSYIDDRRYFTVFFHDEDEISTFEINNTLINELNEIEEEYQSQFLKQGRPLCFHKGKEYADIFVSEGKIEYASSEYYGIWAYNGNSICEISDRLSFAFSLATTAYSGFMYGFTKVMSMQAMEMAAGQTKTYTNSQYMDVVESQKAIADISDDVAIQLGKTDITSTSTARRTWRASEMRVAENYPMSSGFEYNKSYKIVDGKLTQVPHGTAGSQRPDFYNPSTNHIIEVKNYTVTTQAGRNSLANNIATQYNNRKTMFSNAYIEFKVDIYGQAYTQSMLEDIVDLVSTLTGEDIVRFIYD